MRIGAWSLAMVLSASSVGAGSAGPLPFADGRYVTDSRLCAMSEDEMIAEHGDWIGTMVRNIKGPSIDNNYEMFCTVLKVRSKGQEIVFDAICDAEGEKERIQATYMRLTDSSFRLGQRVFKLCGTASSVQKYPEVTAPPEVIVYLWHEADDDCRGLLAAHPKMHTGCMTRDVYDQMLKERGWCYGRRGDEASYEYRWHVCAPDSLQE